MAPKYSATHPSESAPRPGVPCSIRDPSEPAAHVHSANTPSSLKRSSPASWTDRSHKKPCPLPPPSFSHRGSEFGPAHRVPSSFSKRTSRLASSRIAPITVPKQKLGVLEVAGDPRVCRHTYRAGITTPRTADLKLPTPKEGAGGAEGKMQLPGFSEMAEVAAGEGEGEGGPCWSAVRWDFVRRRSAGGGRSFEFSPKTLL